jgi:hypothetical protein
MTQRQQILMLWLSSSSLDSGVVAWSFHDGTAGAGPQLESDPPYKSGVAALVDGWRLIQMSQLLPHAPGNERETSYLKHEFLFEKLIDTP